MALSQKLLGHRLQEARKSVSLTQQEAAENIKISREALAQIERGSRNVTSLEISRLARLYRRSLSVLLLDEETSLEETDVLATLFGMDEALLKIPGLQEQIVWFVNVLEEANGIKRMLGNQESSMPPDYRFRDPEKGADAYTQGQELACQERQRLGLGWRPVPNLDEVLAEQGVWSLSLAMPESISGICLSNSKIGAAVILNRNHHPYRRRFAYAHEYAHFLLDRKKRAVSISNSNNAKELLERRANSFASEFLMPTRGVGELLSRLGKDGTSREIMWFYDPSTECGEPVEKRNAPGSQEIGLHDIAFITEWFQVPYAAVAYRLFELGKIKRDRLLQLMDQRGLSSHSYESCDGEQSLFTRNLRWLAHEAYRREVISGGRFREFCALANLDVETEYTQAREQFD